MTLSDLAIQPFNDTKHRVVCLRQLSYLLETSEQGLYIQLIQKTLEVLSLLRAILHI